MTYPQGQVPQQFQQYQPPAEPQYAQPQVPQYYPPQQPMPIQQGYPAQQYGQVPPGYQYPQAAPAAALPMPSSTLDDFYNQPSTGGGPGWKFQTIGTRHVGQVARPLHDGDVQPVTDFRTGAVVTYRDGRAKQQLVIPLIEPNGEAATWYVKGKDRDALAAAMAQAGAPAGPPEAGAWIMVTYVADKPSGQGLNPTKVKDVQYVRPGADTPAAPEPQAAPAPVQQSHAEYQHQLVQQAVDAMNPQQQLAFAQAQFPQGAPMPGPVPPAGIGPVPMPTAPAPQAAPAPIQQPVTSTAPASNVQELASQLPPEQAALFANMLKGAQG